MQETKRKNPVVETFINILFVLFIIAMGAGIFWFFSLFGYKG